MTTQSKPSPSTVDSGSLLFLFVWKIMPETQGRTLEEIERSWMKS
jgi:hypothetical protein